MTLLEELRDETRNYWLVPASPTGRSDHPDLELFRVQKGANPENVEFYLRTLELRMLILLELGDDIIPQTDA